ncbi:MAG: phosphoribosylamine--glycine ligase [Aeromicrobium sp.]|nr:MAG: phosphoribosylamine--glycine ligase [Aeromicrobium sp.]
MKVLVIGTGGREHALALALSRDPQVTEVHAAPGNPGIGAFASLHPVTATDGADVAALANRLGVDLVVIGPEAPLVAGVADAVRQAGVACFGPSAQAAQLEGSKAFAKQVMAEAGVPTAEPRVCTTPEEVEAALDFFGAPYVVKDDALAAGKGVVVTSDRAEALDHANSCERVVIEAFLDGPEVSLFAITDGVTVVPLQPAQDFKRALDNDAGPNTGGMGAYSPLDWAPETLIEDVSRTVLQPTVDRMRERGTPFQGLLYAGLALTKKGIEVVEFNARFGDPETQVLMALLDSSIGDLLWGAATGTLDSFEAPAWKPGSAVTVVVSSQGYPAQPRTGDVIEGLREANAVEGVDVIHAGTARNDADELVTAGGRVLAVTAQGSDLAEARARAYEAIGHIRIDGAHHRTDIALAAEQQRIQL